MDEQKKTTDSVDKAASAADKVASATHSTQPKGIMDSLDKIFGDRGPVQLPVAAKDWIAQYAWIFVLIGVIIRGLGILALLGLGFAFSGLAAATGTFSFFSAVGLGLLFLIGEGLLLLISIPGVKARKLSGWTLVFYAEVLAIIGNLLSLNIIGALISALIGFFFLFQIRSRFSK